MDLDAHNQPELRCSRLQTLNTHLMAAGHITGYHSQLIGEGQFRCVTIVGGDAGEGILLVAHGLVETFADIPDKVHHTSVGESGGQRQRVHKHAEGVLDADVAASAADGTDIQVFIAGKAGKDQERGCQRQVGRCHGMFATELFHGLHVDGTIQLCRPVALVGRREVGRQFRGALAGAQQLVVVGLVGLGGFLLLVGGVVQVGIGLCLHASAFQYLAELDNEEVE